VTSLGNEQKIDRRHLIVSTATIAAGALLGLHLSVSTGKAATGKEVQGRLRRLTEPGGGDNRATFMPDGNTVLFASQRSGRSQIWGIDRDGSRQRRFRRSAANDYGRVASNADGTQLCFSSDRAGQNAVYVLDVASGHVKLISDPAFWSFGPTWSSRDVIAFFTAKGGNVLNIWTVRPDGSQSNQTTDQQGTSRQPWWSPDGCTLAISADRGTGAFAVWVVAADGSNARPITNDGIYAQPFWSPDGKSIAVSAKIDESYRRIYIMAADGSDRQLVKQPEGIDNVHPAWSPDGRSIVFTSGTGTEASLFILDLA
jgi:TolB protein